MGLISHVVGAIAGGAIGSAYGGSVGSVVGGVGGGIISDACMSFIDRPCGYFETIADGEFTVKDGLAIAGLILVDGVTGYAVGKCMQSINEAITDYKSNVAGGGIGGHSYEQLSHFSSSVTDGGIGRHSFGQLSSFSRVSYLGTGAGTGYSFGRSSFDVVSYLGTGVGTDYSFGRYSFDDEKQYQRNKQQNFEGLYKRKSSPVARPAKSLKDLQPGSAIRWDRTAGYSHYAIVTNISEEKNMIEFIHFGSSNNPTLSKIDGKAKIERVKQPFKPDGMYLIEHQERLPHEKSVEIAEYILNLPDSVKKEYNLLCNNCEHLVNYCVTGVAESQQVQNAMKRMSDMAKEFGVRVFLGPTIEKKI